jgi:putative isomerase
MFYRSLTFMAEKLGLLADKNEWLKKGKDLSARITNMMWDKEKGYFSDTNRLTGEVSDVLSPASFMPLYIGIATEEQAEAMRIVAEERFRRRMPTVSFDHPEYSNDYWRGPTWLNVAYFAAKGLKNYGFSVADDIKAWILDSCFADKGGIYENYDSLTGKGLYCNHFSWSCVFVLEFIFNFGCDVT